jgi:hypothetical protein
VAQLVGVGRVNHLCVPCPALGLVSAAVRSHEGCDPVAG